MRVILNLPDEIALSFGQDVQGLSRVALESLVLEGIRSAKVSNAQARRVLGFKTRYQMDTFLKIHGVNLPFTLDQVRRDSETALALSK